MIEGDFNFNQNFIINKYWKRNVSLLAHSTYIVNTLVIQ